MKDKDKKCRLIKMFRNFPDKTIYEGTLHQAKKRIPPSKKEQFRIEFIDGDNNA